MRKYLNLRSNIGFGLILAFVLNILGPLPLVQADTFYLPKPGQRVFLSPSFNPPILKGIKVHPDNPFRFDFILDVGDRQPPSKGSVPNIKQESTKLIKYFLASLTIPEKDLWVNLSPYEKNRIVPEAFGRTEMGRDLLAEDYMLKQITASLMYPEGETGKKFWKHIYQEAARRFGTTNIPVNTFNKVWIVPEKAIVYENTKAGTAYVVESKLKVMLEEDYLATQKYQSQPGDMFPAKRGTCPQAGCQSNELLNAKAPQGKNQSQIGHPNISQLGSQIIREIIIPELSKEINQGSNFAQLRQVYNSLILATWYKKKIKDSILAVVYESKNKVLGVEYRKSIIQKNPVILSATKDLKASYDSSATPQNDTELIYQRYLQAFKRGVYNYIKDERDLSTQQSIPRKYFSGGADLAMTSTHLGSQAYEASENPSLLGNIDSPSLKRVDVDFIGIRNNVIDQSMRSTKISDLLKSVQKDPDAVGSIVDAVAKSGVLNDLLIRYREAEIERNNDGLGSAQAGIRKYYQTRHDNISNAEISQLANLTYRDEWEHNQYNLAVNYAGQERSFVLQLVDKSSRKRETRSIVLSAQWKETYQRFESIKQEIVHGKSIDEIIQQIVVAQVTSPNAQRTFYEQVTPQATIPLPDGSIVSLSHLSADSVVERNVVNAIMFEHKDGALVLSNGEGQGHLALSLERKGVNILGIDISPRNVAQAKKRGFKNMQVGNAYKLPFEDQSFDEIIFNESLGSLDLARALPEAWRVLKPGGKIMITLYTPYAEDGGRQIRFVQYSVPTVKHALTAVGFKVSHAVKPILDSRGRKAYDFILAVKDFAMKERQQERPKQLSLDLDGAMPVTIADVQVTVSMAERMKAYEQRLRGEIAHHEIHVISRVLELILKEPEAQNQLREDLRRIMPASISDARIDGILMSVRQGHLDSLTSINPTERKYAYEALFKRSKIWKLTNGNWVGFNAWAMGMAIKYFGFEGKYQDKVVIKFASNFADFKKEIDALSPQENIPETTIGFVSNNTIVIKLENSNFDQVLFTLFHEVAHIVLHMKGQENPDVNFIDEGMAESFAVYAFQQFAHSYANDPGVLSALVNQLGILINNANEIYSKGYLFIESMRLAFNTDEDFSSKMMPVLASAVRGGNVTVMRVIEQFNQIIGPYKAAVNAAMKSGIINKQTEEFKLLLSETISRPGTFDPEDVVERLNSFKGVSIDELFKGELIDFDFKGHYKYSWIFSGRFDPKKHKAMFKEARVNQDGFCEIVIDYMGTKQEEVFEIGRFIKEVPIETVEKEITRPVLEIVDSRKVAMKLILELMTGKKGLNPSKKIKSADVNQEYFLSNVWQRGGIYVEPIENYKPVNWHMVNIDHGEGWKAFLTHVTTNDWGYHEITVKFVKENEEDIIRKFEIGRIETLLSPKDSVLSEDKNNWKPVFDIVPDFEIPRRVLAKVIANESKYDTKSILSDLSHIIGLKISDSDVKGLIEISLGDYFTYPLPLVGKKDPGWDCRITNVEAIDNLIFVEITAFKSGQDPIVRTLLINGTTEEINYKENHRTVLRMEPISEVKNKKFQRIKIKDSYFSSDNPIVFDLLGEELLASGEFNMPLIDGSYRKKKQDLYVGRDLSRIRVMMYKADGMAETGDRIVKFIGYQDHRVTGMSVWKWTGQELDLIEHREDVEMMHPTIEEFQVVNTVLDIANEMIFLPVFDRSRAAQEIKNYFGRLNITDKGFMLEVVRKLALYRISSDVSSMRRNSFILLPTDESRIEQLDAFKAASKIVDMQITGFPIEGKSKIPEWIIETLEKLGVAIHPDNVMVFLRVEKKNGLFYLKLTKPKMDGAMKVSYVRNMARSESQAVKKGGIDFTSDKAMRIQADGGGIKFKIDPAQIQRLQNTAGFVPHIIDIQPMDNVREFLGVSP